MNDLLSPAPTSTYILSAISTKPTNGDRQFSPFAVEIRRKNFAMKSLADRNSGRRSPSPTAKMNTTYPEDLSPNDHPILKDHPQRSKSASGGTPPTSTTTDKQRRPKSAHQQLSRYYTMPVTFEEISEIDEELYLKQQPKEEDLEADDRREAASLRRTMSFGGTTSSGANGCHPARRSSFELRNTTKLRSYSAGAVLSFTTSSSTCGSGGSTTGRCCKQRSQDSLVHLGVSTLPTIPEEWRQQQHHHQIQQNVEESKPLQRSQSAEAASPS